MNLSSYLQMPPAPSVPSSTATPTPQGVRMGASPSVGGNLGFDFAQVMARQIQRLVPQERQTLAGDGPKNPEPQARDTHNSRRSDDEHASASADQRSHVERKSRQNETSATSAPSDTSDSSEDDHKDRLESHARPRAKAITPKTTPIDAATLLNGVATTTPVTPVQTAPAADTNLEAAASTEAAPLQTIELSPQVRIITDPQKAPSPESLAAFAKSMGLDESTIHNLLGQQATPAGVDPTGATASPVPSLVLAAAPQANAAGLLVDGTAPGALPNTALNALSLTTTPDGVATTQAQNLADALASTAATASAPVSGAGLALSATTLNAPALAGLSPTDMAAIQQVQITVLPAAVLPVNVNPNIANATPSTIDMLSLLGSGVDEKEVSALLTRFNEETGGQETSPDQHESQGENSNFSSFAQALARNNNAATNNTNAAQAAAPNMSEVYDQLSDKMATELAARMHKQLSDGEWKMKFGLRPSNLGGVEIHLEMKDGKLDAVFHADNPLTRELLQNSSQRLREALGNFGINAGQVNVGQGGSNTQQNGSGNLGKRPQVRDNSSSQVNGSEPATSVNATRNKANASLLDLYA